jgi:putative RNA 2'-phosphotransferase
MARLPKQLESLARMLTYILCHRPDEFCLVLNDDGFIPLKQLLSALAAEPGWSFVRRHHLEQLVGLLSPPAFEIASNQIRALSPEPARLRRAPGETPPALLYIAIPPKAHARVWEEGLRPPPNRELVLATTQEAAVKLGRRRAPHPIVVIVQAQAAARRGLELTGYGEGLYLAPALPRELLQLPPPPVVPERPKPETVRPTPGTFVPDLAKLYQPPQKLHGKTKKDEPAWKSGARKARRQGEKGKWGNDLGGKGKKGKRGKW